MSPEQISVIPNLARIKFGPYQISKNGLNRQYRNIFNLGQIWNNGYVFSPILTGSSLKTKLSACMQIQNSKFSNKTEIWFIHSVFYRGINQRRH